MSTRFGIPIREVDIQLGDENGIFDYINENFFREVARIGNSGLLYWSIPLFHKFSDDIRVYALDNSQQGIYTIGDIKKQINKMIQQAKEMHKEEKMYSEEDMVSFLNWYNSYNNEITAYRLSCTMKNEPFDSKVIFSMWLKNK